ncbi:MAG: YbjN domain-containing protein [Acidimicrobiia bacterium]|nr:YbjN domain-containing protein [Acidimicrobiia bacterium]
MSDALGRDGIESVERQLDGWLAELADTYDHIASVDKVDDDSVRWFVRMRGDEKEFTTVWLTLGQRTLRYDTYVMPAPEENARELYEQLLRRNDRLVGAHFSIGAEDGIFLRGEILTASLSFDEIDRVLGTLYAQVEQCFAGLLRVGFASRFQN